MNIKTIGHNLEYNLWLVAVLFFDDNEDVNIVSEARQLRSVLTVDTKIEFEGKSVSGTYSFECAKNEDEHTQRKICTAVCGMSFIRAASRLREKNLPWGAMTGIRPAKFFRQLLDEGYTDEDAFSYLKKLYGASDEKLSLALAVAKNEREILSLNKKGDIGLYVGIPFCPTRCLYCSFVSADLRHTKKYVDEYVRLLKEEIKYSAELINKNNLNVTSIYFGGGTPTSVSAEHLGSIIKTLKSEICMKNVQEFCVEAGRPDTFEKEKLEMLRENGVDRISINPQTMNDSTLRLIGRSHTADDIIKAFSMARSAGFENINTDLIAGLPKETHKDFGYTLSCIKSLAPESITVHTMSVKRGSALRQSLSDFSLTDAAETEKMLSLSFEFMQENGYIPYYMYRQKNMLGNFENVGYAKRGYFSLYNVNIMEEACSILALGGGGSSKYVDTKTNRIERVFNYKSPVEYTKNFPEILRRKDEFFNMFKEKC